MRDEALTEVVIGCAFKVHNNLGEGFLENVYENALAHELHKKDIRFTQQAPIQVIYDGKVVGDYYADLWVEERVIVEIKDVQSLHKRHEVQLVNYLTATGVDTGLLLNFGRSVQIKRKFRKHHEKTQDLQD